MEKFLFVFLIFVLLVPCYVYAQPAGITNLSALTGQNAGKVDLTWTYPGPDILPSGSKYLVQHSSYDVVWSTTDAQIEISTTCSSGQTQEYTVTGLTSGTTYYFRVWTSSSTQELVSSISNGATAQTKPSLQLISPNGTETFIVYEECPITWSSTGTISNVKIEYSSDSFTTVYTIAASTPDLGAHSWTIPDFIYDTVKVRISDVSDPSVYDISNANFKIKAGFTIYSPNGGENWNTGESQSITWFTSGTVVNVALEYSKDNFGVDIILIEASVVNSGSYFWTIPNDTSTLVKVKVKDAGDNTAYDVSDDSFTIIDNIPPIVVITDPMDNSYKNSLSLLTISGTAWDNILVSTVQVSIKISTPGGNYWNGSNFSSPTQIWRNCDLITSDWAYPPVTDNIPLWVDGSTYTVVARAIDSSGNYSTIYATGTFTYDISLPTAAVTLPVDADFHGPSNPLSTISGTSVDDNSGVDKVEILIHDLTQGTTYWDGSNWVAFSTWVVCTGTDPWIYTSSPSWNDGQYQITPRAIDFASNISSNTPVNFIYDATNPTTQIILPPNLSKYNNLPTISGSADGTPGEPNQVEIRIYNEATFKYCDPVSKLFSLDDPTIAWFVAKPSITWSIWYATSTSPFWSTDADYRIEAKSQDKALNWDTIYSTITFTYDFTPPVAEITYPANDSYIKSLGTISGTSNDSCGVSTMTIAIRENSTDKWWDGVSFSSDTLYSIDVNPPFDNWAYTGLTSSALTVNTSYYITCYAMDNATNELDWYIADSTFTYIPSATKLQVLLPNETPTSGTPPGKSGPVTDQTAGAIFDITVNAVDDNWFIDTTTEPVVTVTTSDPYDSPPPPKTLVNGTTTFTVTLITAQISSITVAAVGLSTDTCSVNVIPNTAAKLQLLVPDEYSVPGSPAGKSGTVAIQIVGTTFTVTVNGTDDYWNKNSTAVVSVEMTTTDLFGVIIPVVSPLVSGTQTFKVCFQSSGTWDITASDTIFTLTDSTNAVQIYPQIPKAPTGFTGTSLSTTSIKWQWTDNELFEDGYILRTSTDGIIKTLTSNASFYIEKNLNPNTAYSRYVEVYNIISGTTSSNTDTVYTLANPPTNLTSPNQTILTVELSWTEGDGGNTAYYVQISTDGSNYTTIDATLFDSLTVENYTATGLSSDTTYFFRVGGYNGDGYPTSPSNTIEVKTEEIPPDTILGKVTQSNYQPITGVAVIASLGAQSWTVYTSTDGTYEFTGLIYSTCYIITCEWTVNDIKSSVFKDNIGTGSDEIDFTLEQVNYELATIIGRMDIGRPRSPLRARLTSVGQAPLCGISQNSTSQNLPYPRVELIQNGKVIAKVCTDSGGNYTIPNLLPGKYTLRAYNGQIYSSPKQISLAEGQNSVVIFNFEIFPGEQVYAYPNPVKSPENSVTIRFYYNDTLPPETEIRIYNIAVELVKTVSSSELEVDGSIYKYEWDFTKDKVASGIYIYQIKIPGEKTVSKKLGVIK